MEGEIDGLNVPKDLNDYVSVGTPPLENWKPIQHEACNQDQKTQGICAEVALDFQTAS